MRNHITHLATAILIAAAGVACTGRNHAVNNDRRDQSGGARGVNQRIALRGCVQPAPSGQGLALSHVVMVPLAEQPQGGDAVDDTLIPRGSWVHLAASNEQTDDLKKYVGNQVTVTGDIVETGENTVGTAGKGGSAQEQMPARSSVANGDAPKVAVEHVNKVADQCAEQ